MLLHAARHLRARAEVQVNTVWYTYAPRQI
jgi:hypothetical protein